MTRAAPRTRRTEPSSAPSRARLDAATYLTVVLVLQLCIPTTLQIAALGAAGTPAVVLGLPGLVWWIWGVTRGPEHRRGSPIIRWATGVWVMTILIGYVAAMSRALPPQESLPADNGLLRAAAWAGIALLACDGLTRDRLSILANRLVWVATALAVVGLLQFITSEDLVDAISLPGFVRTQAYQAVQERAGFARAAGTASHPLEFAIVLCSALPFAIARAAYATRRPWRAWVPVIVLSAACLLSVSRSTLVGFALAFVLMLPVLSTRQRQATIAGGLTALIAVYVSIPGMGGTILNMFMTAADDDGVRSRVDGYDLVVEIVGHAPWTGRGFGTFLPQYRILDNQYLMALVETGVLGVAGLVGLLVVAAWRAYRASTRAGLVPQQRATGRAIMAAVIATATLLAFFDAFSFPMAPMMIFLLVGLSGAYEAPLRLRSDTHGSSTRSRSRR